jgi:hypothetical protein
VADATDHLGAGKQRPQRRNLGGPEPMGVEHDLLRMFAEILAVERA